MPPSLASLFAHMGWADARVLGALRSAPQSNSKALELFAHVVGAEHVWLCRLNQRTSQFAVWPSISLDECASLAEENQRGYEEFLEGLCSDDLAREIAYTNSAGVAFRSAIQDILMHVALHGSYHRGQIAMAMRQSGGDPAATDYIAFVRGAPAATRVSSATSP